MIDCVRAGVNWHLSCARAFENKLTLYDVKYNGVATIFAQDNRCVMLGPKGKPVVLREEALIYTGPFKAVRMFLSMAQYGFGIR